VQKTRFLLTSCPAQHINRNPVHKAIMGIRKKFLLWQESLDCHVKNTDKSNSTTHQTVSDKAANLPPVSWTLEANLPPGSTTPALPVPKYTVGVVDTGGKFVTGVVDTGGVP
jgi:hypothetical protein